MKVLNIALMLYWLGMFTGFVFFDYNPGDVVLAIAMLQSAISFGVFAIDQ